MLYSPLVLVQFNLAAPNALQLLLQFIIPILLTVSATNADLQCSLPAPLNAGTAAANQKAINQCLLASDDFDWPANVIESRSANDSGRRRRSMAWQMAMPIDKRRLPVAATVASTRHASTGAIANRPDCRRSATRHCPLATAGNR